MVTVRRLLGLNAAAGSEDIRAFFHDLHIPEGGVHIIGGRRGEAFIIFTTERDGQLAMERSGELLRGSSITLHVSSLAELKYKLEARLGKQQCSPVEKKTPEMEKKAPKIEEKKQEVQLKVAEAPQATPQTDLGAALLLGLVAAIQAIQSNNQESPNQSLPANSPQLSPVLPQPHQSEKEEIQTKDQIYNHNKMKESIVKPVGVHRGETKSPKPGYLRLYGLPNYVTKKEVCWFLKGLSVLEVIPDVFLGQDQCCLVKLASLEEAEEGLKCSRRNLDDSCVMVRTANERMWTNAMEFEKKSSTSSELDRISPDRPLRQTSPVKRLSEDRSLSGSPKRYRFDSPTLSTEYCVMVKNLPSRTTKTEIKDIFSCRHIPNNKIIHLLNKWGERTSTAFLIFTHPEDYALAMNMDGSPNGSKTLNVSSITKEKMRQLMYLEKHKETERTPSGEKDCSPLSCIYARNFPADVRKRDVKNFFCPYRIREDDITLLKDENGNGVGEAVVEFHCEQTAREARSLHGVNFLGQQIFLNCISKQQMRSHLGEMC
ncbi:RNA binding motif protein 12Ba [Hoplias malabaricus]|uniref:RNA binding motif protein 12Ba n=1 Tax=Hoplias malabaricus TaxID=27720 RepID=UPI00346319FA